MPHTWTTDIERLLGIKQSLLQIDRKRVYPLITPQPGATAADLATTEAALGRVLDAQYRDFLRVADGWRRIYSRVNLFGTIDLCGSDEMTFARQTLEQLDAAGALREAGVCREELLPIAVAPGDVDLFVQMTPDSATPGAVIWFAREEIERYADFAGFLAAMIEANEDIIMLMQFSRGMTETRNDA